MGKRYLVRTRAGDHIARGEEEILEWLKQGHCGPGDAVYLEEESRWLCVCELPLIAPQFTDKPNAKLEKPVITVFRLGHGRSLQQGPFTLSAVLDMIALGEVCASSWIFVDGDKEWRQVKHVKLLREALPGLPSEAPQLELKAVVQAAAPAAPTVPILPKALKLPSAPMEISMESPAESPAPLPATGFTLPPNSPMAEITGQSQPSIVPMPEGLVPEAPSAIPTVTKTATLTKSMVQPSVEEMNLVNVTFGGTPFSRDAAPPQFEPTSDGFVPAPNGQDFQSTPPGKLSLESAPEEVSVKIDSQARTLPPGQGDFDTAPPSPPITRFDYRQQNPVDEIPEDEQTKAVSKLGLAQKLVPIPEFNAGGKTSDGFVPSPDVFSDTNISQAPQKAPAKKPTAPPAPSAAALAKTKTKLMPPPPPEDTDDGIVVEISQEPIWIIKQDQSERVVGPYAFSQVIDMLKVGQIHKDDKISKKGSNRFCKISQQYEFNVKYSVETVVERGVERQKILIKRRHPRVAYMADVQILAAGEKFLGKCVNISAGGILLESHDLEVSLGDTIQLEIMANLIPRKISVRALVIGRIPKKPPSFALKFQELKVEDKEAIEYFVVESLKKEKAIGM